MVTARKRIEGKVEGDAVGADICLTKPAVDALARRIASLAPPASRKTYSSTSI